MLLTGFNDHYGDVKVVEENFLSLLIIARDPRSTAILLKQCERCLSLISTFSIYVHSARLAFQVKSMEKKQQKRKFICPQSPRTENVKQLNLNQKYCLLPMCSVIKIFISRLCLSILLHFLLMKPARELVLFSMYLKFECLNETWYLSALVNYWK